MIDLMIERSNVGDVLGRVMDGERLSIEDGVRLFESDDITAIGAAANEIRRRLNGNLAYYVVNRHINYTDICKNRCRFCAFSRDQGDSDAYAMSVQQIVEQAESEWQRMRYSELHIVGGLHPTLPLSYYTDMLSSLSQRLPTIHIQAFTVVEIAHIAEIARISVREALAALKDAGLGSIPGGGAEVFSPRVRSIVCPEKMPGSKWLEVMREAHSLEIKSNATMLFGHVETHRERIEHMAALRELQDETGGFMTFIPLKFHAANTDLTDLASTTSALDDLKLYSISRLMVDNIPHLKVFWIMLGLKLAQTALSFGADDFDGTVVEEKITHRAGAKTPEGLTVADIKRLIEETGLIPTERDTVYNLISEG